MGSEHSKVPIVIRAALSDFPELTTIIPVAGPILSFVLEEVPPIRRAKAERMLDELLKLLGNDATRFLELLRSSAEFLDLIGLACEASSRSRAEENLKLIAKATKAGFDGGEVEAVDLARLRIATVADLDSIHVAALRRIAATAPVEKLDPVLRGELGNPIGLDAVIATLIRHGLIVAVDSLVGFTGPGYRITAYGAYILSEFDQVPSTSAPEVHTEPSTPP
jgi:hypothetical protein